MSELKSKEWKTNRWNVIEKMRAVIMPMNKAILQVIERWIIIIVVRLRRPPVLSAWRTGNAWMYFGAFDGRYGRSALGQT